MKEYLECTNDLDNNGTKIKPIKLKMHNYSYKHTAINDDADSSFIGRKNIIQKLRSFINDSSADQGAFLVTGYRGMGKTSTINKALSVFKNEGNNLVNFTLILLLSLLLNLRFDNTHSEHLIFLLSLLAILSIAIFANIYYYIKKQNLKNVLKAFFYFENHYKIERDEYLLIINKVCTSLILVASCHFVVRFYEIHDESKEFEMFYLTMEYPQKIGQ